MGLQSTLPHKSTHATGGSDPLSAVATSGFYSDLSGKPTLGIAASRGIGISENDVAAGNIHTRYYERDSDAASERRDDHSELGVHQVVLANDTRLKNARTPLNLGNLHLRITGTSNLFNTNNSTEYVFPWNEVFITDDYSSMAPIIPPKATVERNIILGSPGWYYFEARYSSFDITNPSAFMRIRLRMSDFLITGANGGTLMDVVAQGRTGAALSGEASVRGNLTLKISSPTYCVFTVLHDSAPTTGYPVFNNDNGLQPYIYIRRLS
jgi:hypothetical protein